MALSKKHHPKGKVARRFNGERYDRASNHLTIAGARRAEQTLHKAGLKRTRVTTGARGATVWLRTGWT
jgi:hypothetical protein